MNECKTGLSAIDRPWLKYYAPEILNAELPKGSLYDYMHSRNADRMDKPVITFFGKTITHREFERQIAECARSLGAYGVKQGDVVSVCMLTTPEVLVLLYAINRIGAICNFLIASNTPEELAYQITSTGSKLVFSTDILSGKVNEAVKIAGVDKLICVPMSYSMPFAIGIGFGLKTRKVEKFGEKWADFLLKGVGREIPKAEVKAEDVAVLEYTSGTTGVPKAAMLANISCNAVAFNYMNSEKVFEFNQGESFLCIVPPFYSIGLVTTLLMPLCVGFKLILSPDPDPTKTAENMLKYKPNHFCGGPLHVDNIVSSEKLQNADLSYVKTIAYGGEKSDPSWEKKATDFFKSRGMEFELVNGYGLTETAGSFCTTAHHCTGMIPFAKNNVMIRDMDTDEVLGYDKEGEICLSGPSLMLGYYKNKEATDEVMFEKDGVRWLRTGDLGTVSPDGAVYVTGRIKRILWTLDADKVVYRIYPMHIEEVICTVPCVKASAVVGLPDKDRGYLPIAYVVLEKGADEAQAKKEIMEVCKAKLSSASVPHEILFLDDLPKTTAGKTDFKSLEAKAKTDFSAE